MDERMCTKNVGSSSVLDVYKNTSILFLESRRLLSAKMLALSFVRSPFCKPLSISFLFIKSSLFPIYRFVRQQALTTYHNLHFVPLFPRLLILKTHPWPSHTNSLPKTQNHRSTTHSPQINNPHRNPTQTQHQPQPLPHHTTMGCAPSKSDQLTPLTPLPPRSRPHPHPRPIPHNPRPIPHTTRPLPPRALPPMPRAPRPRCPPPNANRAAYYATNRMPQGPVRRKPVAMDRYVNRPLPPVPVRKGEVKRGRGRVVFV